MSWTELSEWWRGEIAEDPAYQSLVTPLLLDVLRPEAEALYLDLGCGEGRVMRSVQEQGPAVHGVDLSISLARSATRVVIARLPTIPIRAGTYDGVYSVLALEHVEDHVSFFLECARVTKPAGVLAIVLNHPIWTAPESTPITDEDGEVLWRPGEYFSRGSSTIPAGNSTVTFHHRSMSELLNAAANGGWSLEHLIELPHHEFEDQSGIPRLLACRWRLLP
jgi:SAM-dependent methyltransferase